MDLQCVTFIISVVQFVIVLCDYPPDDITVALPDVRERYPVIASHSRFCFYRPDGNYPHHDDDLGDPRCTFVMCSNRQTIIQQCPSGTRTDFFYLPYIYRKALRLSKKVSSSHDVERQLRQDYRNRKSEHGICDYFDYGGVCGEEYPRYTSVVTRDKTYGLSEQGKDAGYVIDRTHHKPYRQAPMKDFV